MSAGGYATAISRVNIALVKYWGKRDVAENLPAVSSISLTLDGLDTTTTVTFSEDATTDAFWLNDERLDDPRVFTTVNEIRTLARIDTRADIRSTNRVPTASGLASSASGFSALALATWAAAGLTTNQIEANQAFLNIVRRGSGSAPRSLLGGVVSLAAEDGAVEQLASPDEWPLCMVVCRLSAHRKSTSSRRGMEHSRLTSAYYDAWVASHDADIQAAKSAITERDLASLGRIMERSTMKMHACMLASDPPLRYLKGRTLDVLDKIEAMRARGLNAWYTMDAGPHVKVLCAPEDSDIILAELSDVVPSEDLLLAKAGRGAELTSR